MEINYYNETVKQFIDSLELDSKKQVVKNLELLEEYGYKIGLPHSKSLGNGLFELRCIGSGVRFIYIFNNGKVVILNGFTKKTNKIARKAMDVAKKRQVSWNSYPLA